MSAKTRSNGAAAGAPAQGEGAGNPVTTTSRSQATADGAPAQSATQVVSPGTDRRTTATAKATWLSVEERQARGREIRERVPYSSHAFWAEAPDRPDPVTLLEAQATTRLPDLVPIRYARMQVSPFAYLRGTPVVMAQDLAHTPTTGIQTQLCGDCHLSNFGAYASPERTLLFDINDFDETLPGPWEWDVKRLATSFVVAGRDNGFSAADCRAAVLAAVRSYRVRMTEFAEMRALEVWYSRITADDVVGLLSSKELKKRTEKTIRKARQRDSLQALSKLTEVVDGHRRIVDTPPLVTRINTAEYGAEPRALFDMYMQTVQHAQRRLLERYEIVDMAIKVVGVGSVGTRCFIMLLTGRDDSDPLFLQVKEAEASVLQPYLPASEYNHQGERVVAGQELMQAASDIFLGWMSGPGGRHFYWRQLRDMKASAEIATLSPRELTMYADACGWALARAHARAGDAVQIAAYLGGSDRFDQAIATFASAYADQTQRDYQTFLGAIQGGRIEAAATAG
jgi:uncharacterized protein (DUF2252 family)